MATIRNAAKMARNASTTDNLTVTSAANTLKAIVAAVRNGASNAATKTGAPVEDVNKFKIMLSRTVKKL